MNFSAHLREPLTKLRRRLRSSRHTALHVIGATTWLERERLGQTTDRQNLFAQESVGERTNFRSITKEWPEKREAQRTGTGLPFEGR